MYMFVYAGGRRLFAANQVEWMHKRKKICGFFEYFTPQWMLSSSVPFSVIPKSVDCLWMLVDVLRLKIEKFLASNLANWKCQQFAILCAESLQISQVQRREKAGDARGKRMFGFWCSENPHNSLDIRVVISSCLWCNLHLYIEKIEMLKISFTYISLRNEQEKWTLECNPNRRLGRCGVRRHKSDTSRNSYADSNWTRFQFELLRILFSGFHSH